MVEQTSVLSVPEGPPLLIRECFTYDSGLAHHPTGHTDESERERGFHPPGHTIAIHPGIGT